MLVTRGSPAHSCRKARQGLAGLEVLQPGVVERKAQKQAAEVVVLHHVGVVGDAVFQCTAQRHDHHLVAVRLGQLPEPRQDVVAEVLRLCVIHVGDENCDAARCVLPADAGIAQLHGGLDHRFAHGIADAACTAQRLGNSTFETPSVRAISSKVAIGSLLCVCFASFVGYLTTAAGSKQPERAWFHTEKFRNVSVTIIGT